MSDRNRPVESRKVDLIFNAHIHDIVAAINILPKSKTIDIEKEFGRVFNAFDKDIVTKGDCEDFEKLHFKVMLELSRIGIQPNSPQFTELRDMLRKKAMGY
ncbi:hypothetical protein [Flammeovirga sp. OC4]|uniref:hypothetical protein n=1 Tax=Flammeovirga sp. OC4 TaxID=1382345 RepID=UPI0005C6586F|nr:hypothetical protein [Flammeovirga sp. OC4]